LENELIELVNKNCAINS